MEKGQIVKVYDGDLVGFVSATLLDRVCVLEKNILERWTMITEHGYILTRIVRPYKINPPKDGCAYLLF